MFANRWIGDFASVNSECLLIPIAAVQVRVDSLFSTSANGQKRKSEFGISSVLNFRFTPESGPQMQPTSIFSACANVDSWLA